MNAGATLSIEALHTGHVLSRLIISLAQSAHMQTWEQGNSITSLWRPRHTTQLLPPLGGKALSLSCKPQPCYPRYVNIRLIMRILPAIIAAAIWGYIYAVRLHTVAPCRNDFIQKSVVSWSFKVFLTFPVVFVAGVTGDGGPDTAEKGESELKASAALFIILD